MGRTTLATKRTLHPTWAGLSPAGSHQLCGWRTLFNDLVGELLQLERHVKTECLGGLEIDDQLVFRLPQTKTRALPRTNKIGVCGHFIVCRSALLISSGCKILICLFCTWMIGTFLTWFMPFGLNLTGP